MINFINFVVTSVGRALTPSSNPQSGQVKD